MKKGRLLVALFIIAVLVLYVIIYIIPKMSNMLENTTVLKYGTLPVTDSAEAVIIRNETLFVSGSEGKLKYKIDEGTKVRKGTAIAQVETGRVVERKKDSDGNEIEPESEFPDVLVAAGDNFKVSKDFKSNISGVVSYYVDGYEEKFAPDNIKNLNKSDIAGIENAEVNVKRDATLKGDPIFKTANNTVWYLVIWKEKDEPLIDYQDNSKVKVDIGKTQINAKVKSIYEKDNGNLIVLETDMYYKNFAKYRKAKISVVFAEYQGFIIENKSIIKTDDIPYVYVKQTDGSFEKIQVKILATSGEYSVLAVKSFYDEDGNEIKTVNYYEEVLVDPED